jgi:hypothetical protein
VQQLADGALVHLHVEALGARNMLQFQKALQFSKSTSRRGSLCLSPADQTSAVAFGHEQLKGATDEIRYSQL